jgi:hypothetical protein|tara:strand:+ start:386 stop:1168 length:783 start_codon:yes stop_codon:yes gene_type:complete
MLDTKTRAVIFDLDDTIGHFEQFSMFKYGLDDILETNPGKKFFIKLLDVFPNIFRPGIMNVLKYLKNIKKRDKHLKVIIYTNNNGPRSWTLLIKDYLEHKINYNLFDKVITKYDTSSAVNCRTTYQKTHSDLIKCTDLPKHAKILFLDDQEHEKMNHKNITYLKLHGYNFHIKPKIMIKKFLKSKLGKIIPKKEHVKFSKYIYGVLTSEKDFIVSKTIISQKDKTEKKRIIKELKKFINIKKQTRKFYNNKNNRKTRKNK